MPFIRRKSPAATPNTSPVSKEDSFTESPEYQAMIEEATNWLMGPLQEAAVYAGEKIAHELPNDATVSQITESASATLRPIATAICEWASNESTYPDTLKGALSPSFSHDLYTAAVPTAIVTAAAQIIANRPDDKPIIHLLDTHLPKVPQTSKILIAGTLLPPIVDSYTITHQNKDAAKATKTNPYGARRSLIDSFVPQGDIESVDPEIHGIVALTRADKAVTIAKATQGSFAELCDLLPQLHDSIGNFTKFASNQKKSADVSGSNVAINKVQRAESLGYQLTEVIKAANKAPNSPKKAALTKTLRTTTGQTTVDGNVVTAQIASQYGKPPVIKSSIYATVVTSASKPTQAKQAPKTTPEVVITPISHDSKRRDIFGAAVVGVVVTSGLLLNPAAAAATEVQNDAVTKTKDASTQNVISLAVPNKTTDEGESSGKKAESEQLLNSSAPTEQDDSTDTTSNTPLESSRASTEETVVAPILGDVIAEDEVPLSNDSVVPQVTPTSSPETSQSEEPKLGQQSDPEKPKDTNEDEEPNKGKSKEEAQPPEATDTTPDEPTNEPQPTPDAVGQTDPVPTPTETTAPIETEEPQLDTPPNIFPEIPLLPDTAAPTGPPDAANNTEPSAPSEPINAPAQPANPEPGVTTYFTTPDNATEPHVVIAVDPEQITVETSLPAPEAGIAVATALEEQATKGKSDAYKKLYDLRQKYSVESAELANNNVTNQLELLRGTGLDELLQSITDKEEKAAAKKKIDTFIAYAMLLSEDPTALDNSEISDEIFALIKLTPPSFEGSPAAYALFVANNSKEAATSQQYLDNQTTGDESADSYIAMLTTAAVATVITPGSSTLPSLEASTPETAPGTQSPDTGKNQSGKAEFNIDVKALEAAVEKYVEPGVRNDPKKLAYFKMLIVAIAKQVVISQPDVNLEVLAAQGGWETGWGEFANGNNLFGIKAGDNYTGKRFSGGTWEEDADGNKTYGDHDFRDYDTPEESIADRLKLADQPHFEAGCAVSANKYLDSLQNKTSEGPECKILIKGKLAYATGKTYKQDLLGLIENNNLKQIFIEGGLGDYAKRVYEANGDSSRGNASPERNESERVEKLISIAKNELKKDVFEFDSNVLKYTHGLKEGGGLKWAWCADFVTWVAQEAGLDSEFGKSPQWGNYRYSRVSEMQTHFEKTGQFFEKGTKKPRAGDIAIYDGHVNIVIGVEDDGATIITIGGNERSKPGGEPDSIQKNKINVMDDGGWKLEGFVRLKG